MPRIDQRQRLALEVVDGEVRRTVLVVDLEEVGAREPVSRTFARIRKILVDRFGSPARLLEETPLRGDLVAQVNAGTFINLTEWDTGEGVLRLGFPRRQDGQVRIEIHHARALPPPNVTLWSLVELR